MTETGTYFAASLLFHAALPMVMGTRLEWITVGVREKPSRIIWERFRAWVEEASARLNRFDPGSELSRWNRKEGEASPLLRSVMAEGERYKSLTDGLFDTGWMGEGTQDFGGIAKGWALEKARDLLERNGCTCAFVNFGGSSILALGSHPYGPAWQVALPDPFSGTTLDVWELKDTCLSVSGNVPAYTGHIVHPRTGERMTERRLTVAVTPSALDAEVLSTVLMLSPGQAWSERFPAARMKCYNL